MYRLKKIFALRLSNLLLMSLYLCICPSLTGNDNLTLCNALCWRINKNRLSTVKTYFYKNNRLISYTFRPFVICFKYQPEDEPQRDETCSWLTFFHRVVFWRLLICFYSTKDMVYTDKFLWLKNTQSGPFCQYQNPGLPDTRQQCCQLDSDNRPFVC